MTHRARTKLCVFLGSLVLALRAFSDSDPAPAAAGVNATTLQQTRLAMTKWIETQQIISKERKDWQQGKEILLGRLDLVKQEVATLEEKIKQAEASVAQTAKKKGELQSENEQLKTIGTQLSQAVAAMESKTRQLYRSLPDPVQTKLQPLYRRIPEDPAKTKVSAAERFQNILGILNEVNKANNEITVNYEVHTLSDNRPSEVQAVYVGLAQAYYVSAGGEAGISRPTPEGWKAEPAQALSGQILTTLEILQGKQTAAFVPLPVKIQ